MAVAVGSLALSGGVRSVRAQAAKRIESLAPELDKIIAASEPIQELAEGFGGPLGPAEGPVWWQDGGYLLFSDMHNNRRMKYVPGQGVSLDQEPTNRANGLTRDLKGRLVACEHESRRVTRYELDGSLTVIANSFQGRRLNRPNDVVVKSDGCYYFTDPNAGIVPEQWDLTFAGVYRITPDLGTMSLLVDTFVQPNGLAFSPDESVLYINDSRRGHIRAFDLLPTGMLAKQTDRVFAELRGSEPGVPDGMKVDVAGNVYCGGAGGITAADVVNRLPEAELADIIYRYGEERASRRIARRIVETRRRSPFRRTVELAEVVRAAARRPRGRGIDAATLTFQALRIHVNQELEGLGDLLASLARRLAPGGRLAVIAFHSLEDREVKQAFRSLATAGFRLLTRKPVRPGEDEVRRNPRSRSARLRAIEREAA
jgi:gluconolactonase